MNPTTPLLSRLISYILMVLPVTIFMIIYWLFDVVLDVFIFHETDILTSLFHPDKMCLGMRLINLPLILFCFVIAQWMFVKRRTAENTLKEERDRAQKYLDVAGVMLTVLNSAGEVVLINQKGCAILNVTEDEILGKNWFDHYLPKRMVDDVKEGYRSLMAGDIESVEYYEYPVLTSNGEERIIAFHNTVLNGEGENIHGILFSGEDISGLKKAESEKEKLNEQLRQSHKMEAVGTMAGGIAHDFNNILGVIICCADMALDDIPKDNPAWEEVDEIIKASQRAAKLVKQILAFSRRDMICKKPFYLCRLIEENMKGLRATIPTTVEIKINIPAKCRDNITECCKVLVDHTQIHQLLMNLCINAVQAMDEKGVLGISVDEITVEDKRTDRLGLEPGIYEYLTVSDTGSGMGPEIIEQIFDPFFTTKEVGKGTGMGLSVVHGIIESHGGKIFVDSEPGKGTIFHLYFPVVETESEEESQNIGYLPNGTERILFVDDEKMIVKMWSSILSRQGYEVTPCGNSAEALETFRPAPDKFDLVITDQTMPNMSGAELAVELLKIRPDIPIILCTGYSSLIDEAKVKDIGILEFLMKPLDSKQLTSTIRKVLDKK